MYLQNCEKNLKLKVTPRVAAYTSKNCHSSARRLRHSPPGPDTSLAVHHFINGGRRCNQALITAAAARIMHSRLSLQVR